LEAVPSASVSPVHTDRIIFQPESNAPTERPKAVSTGLCHDKGRFCSNFLYKAGCLGIVENMTTFGCLSEKDETGPFYGDLPDDGLRPIETSREAEGIDEGFDKKKKKDNRWHSFKTP
jgi:hypothetical protein